MDNTFCEFDAITLYRENIEEDIGRSLSDDDWDDFTERVGEAIDKASWEAVYQTIEETKTLIG